VVPGIDGPPTPRPIAPPPETEGCATGVGFDIQPASGIGTGAGVGWKGYTHEEKTVQYQSKNQKITYYTIPINPNQFNGPPHVHREEEILQPSVRILVAAY